jgi:hypothetical protein
VVIDELAKACEELGLEGTRYPHSLLWEMEREKTVQDVLALLINERRRQMAAGAVTFKTEWPFGMGGEQPLTVTAGTGAVKLRGRVDRIDRIGDEEAYAVYDYKTGDGPPVSKVVEHGDIQIAVYMMAAVMGTGYLFGLDSSGIKQFLLENIGPVMTGLSPGLFVLVALLGIIIMTSFLSNTLSAAMYTVIIPIAQMVSGVNPIALGLCIAAAVNIADALPSGSPAASMASGSGWTPVSYQIKYGFLLALISLVGFYFIAYPLCSAMFPV